MPATPLPPPTSEVTTINDFRPGIFSDYHASAAERPANTVNAATFMQPGAAVIQDTFGCQADRSGALVPLPAYTAGKTSARLPVASNANGKYVTSRLASYLLDGTILTDMFVNGDQTSSDADRAAVFTMYGQWYETDLFRWTVITTMHRLYEGTTTSDQQDLMFAKSDTSVLSSDTALTAIGGGNFVPFRARYDINSNFTIQAMCWVAYGAPGYATNPPGWTTGAMSAGDQALTDFDTAYGANYPSYASYRVLGIFPNYRNHPTMGADPFFESIAGFTAVHLLAAHQGRLIGASRDHGSFGKNIAATGLSNIVEHIHYTPPFDFNASLGVGDLEFATAGETNPFLSGVVHSVTANELLLIKDQNGAVLVRGDLDDPTIVQLPFLHSTHGARCIPARSPDGMYYGTRNGVYRWVGGETTEHVSAQVDGWFWNPDSDNIENFGIHGRFAYWEPFVAAPNNWLYDTRHKSWWRLPFDGTAIKAYDVAPSSNRLYAFPYKLDSTSAQPMWYTSTPATLASSYSWKSQPLLRTTDRVMGVDRLKLVATNSSGQAATVAVTLSGYTEAGTAVTPITVTFTLNTTNTRPQLQDIVPTTFEAQYIQLKIVATSASGAAPKIHSLGIAMTEKANRVTTTGTVA